jgi:hypothetical protein
VCFMSYKVAMTPATILCHAILENANAFSIHVARLKHKIYRWLCFCHNENRWLGRSKKEFKIVLSIRHKNRDVCYATFIAKSMYLVVGHQVVKQALLKMLC